MPSHSPAFIALRDFIQTRMKMSHIYQPAMLLRLFENGGQASIRDIAKDLLSHDVSQIEYYEEITKNMVGQVLSKRHDIVEKSGSQFSIKAFEELDATEVQQLIDLCKAKIKIYVEKRGDKIWKHRSIGDGYVSGTIKYEVLKRARFRCELCGISADKRALEVDHIIPRSKGGSDDISNFQALCYQHNAMKNNRDDTDFRKILDTYSHRQDGCLFCSIDDPRKVFENELCYAIRDAFPVTPEHTLIIPKRHVATYFELYQPELNAINHALSSIRSSLMEKDRLISGFNIGVNSGASAGQTIHHCHIHLIPRRDGDVENPRGGVRGVIPGKQSY